MGGEILGADGKLDPVAKAALEELARDGLMVDILGPSLPQIAAVASTLPPKLVVVLDHLANKSHDFGVDPAFAQALRDIAPYRNISIKVSDSQRLSEASLGAGWPLPYQGTSDPEAYRPYRMRRPRADEAYLRAADSACASGN